MDNKESRFFVPRNSNDRRSSAYCAPPYLTDEGFVLIDRRENRERRGGARPVEAARESKAMADADWMLDPA